MNNSLFLENNVSQFIIRYNQGQAQKSTRKNKVKPISVSSQISLPSRNKRKLRLNSSQVSSVEKCEKRLPASHSLHTNTDQRKEERQYSRVPIEYMEERDNGNPADRIRGRVVYRGYAPKNTYFYFKTIKELRFVQLSGKVDRDYRGEDISFNSKFESGNLNAAVRVGSREYWLFMREDTNTHGLRQWFYFQARSRKSIKIRLRIYRFTKKYSLYKIGMKPFVRTTDCQWCQNGQKIVYDYDSQQKCYYLQFDYLFQEHKVVYFASLPPYTYSMMTSFLQAVATDSKAAVKKVGLSLGGLDLYSLKISSKKTSSEEDSHLKEKAYKKIDNTIESQMHKPSNKIEKEAIIVLARTHPGQTVSNWSLQSFVQRILEKQELTQHFNFYILPMINPDGVFLGNHRTGILGQDLNRNFNLCDLQYFPELQIVDAYITGIMRKQKVAFLFDLHGHSAKKNIFAFGQECEIGSNRYLFSRIIPKILADSIDSFKIELSLFKASKEKTNTARVYFSKKMNLNAITFEQSYGLLETGCIGISNWKNFGTALADSLLTYAQLTKGKKDEGIYYYLSDYMDAQREEIKQKAVRQQERQKRQKQKEKEKQRQRQRELEEQKQRIIASKTEQNEELSAMLSKYIQKNTRPVQIFEQKLKNQQQIEQKQNQSLSSGDEELEMTQTQLQPIKKQIYRVGEVVKERVNRQLYLMAQKKMELSHQYADYPNRLHHKNSSMVQRIIKFKNRQRMRQMELPHSTSQRERGPNNIELPQIRK